MLPGILSRLRLREIVVKSWVFRWGPAILVMAIIFAASASAKADLPDFGVWDLFAKKGGHLAGYALLAAAFLHGLNNGRRITRLQSVAAVCLALLYATSDEWHQSFVPGRNASVTDVAVDAAGAVIGVTVMCWTRACVSARPRS
jgi:uncharacterized protein YfiM (DUF2279 family)